MCKEMQCSPKLSLAECISLLYVGTNPDRRDLPPAHLSKLTGMGLTRIKDDRIAHTAEGRALAAQTARIAAVRVDTVH